MDAYRVRQRKGFLSTHPPFQRAKVKNKIENASKKQFKMTHLELKVQVFNEAQGLNIDPIWPF